MPLLPTSLDLDVVIPAYNEGRRLPRSLDTLAVALASLELSAGITIVDNASTDDTLEVARAFERDEQRVVVRVLSCSTRGKGAAVRAGVLSSEATWVGFMDADLATSLAALPPTLELLGRGIPVVIGTRRHDMSHLLVEHEALRRVGGWAFRAAVRTVVQGVADTQCGFKFFDAVTARRLFADLQLAGWAFDVEILARAQACGFAVGEVPVQWANQPGSRFAPVTDGIRAFGDVARIRRLARRAMRDLPAPNAHSLP